jgi:hypothetical protein
VYHHQDREGINNAEVNERPIRGSLMGINVKDDFLFQGILDVGIDGNAGRTTGNENNTNLFCISRT